MRRRARATQRRLARLQRGGPGLDLGRAWLEYVDLLIELEEDEEARRELQELLPALTALSGAEAEHLLVNALSRRIRLGLRDEARQEQVLEDLARAIAVLEGREERTPELRELEVELHVHRGRLLLVRGDEEAGPALARSVALARQLDTGRARLLVMRARRELAVALAQDDVEAGLAELDRAERSLGEGALVSQTERDLLVSTRAELLANARRFDEAIALLARVEADWALAQRASTLDLAGRGEDALEAGAQLIERRNQKLDPRAPATYQGLAEALLSQARRAPDPAQRLPLAERVLQLFDLTGPPLPVRSTRLVVQALELKAAQLDPDDAHEVLRQRVILLEGLVTELDLEDDAIELVRACLQEGDGLMRLGELAAARRCYARAIRQLEDRFEPEHPVVLGLLPLALAAHGHAMAGSELWLATRRRLDEAVAAISPATLGEALAGFADVFMFRAIACVNVGDAEGAVAHLERDVARLLGAALRADDASEASELGEAAVSLSVLQAEILVDQLDRVDAAVAGYDQAVALVGLGGDGVAMRASILGAKGTMLARRGRGAEALPALRESVELFQRDGPRTSEGQSDLALARISLAAALNGVGQPREALSELQGVAGTVGEADRAGPEQRLRALSVDAALLHQRGEALREVGHPLLAVDELGRAIDLYRELLEDEGPARYEASQQLPVALVLRARCWREAGEHEADAAADLRDARRRLEQLIEDEGRPEHARLLAEVEALAGRGGDEAEDEGGP